MIRQELAQILQDFSDELSVVFSVMGFGLPEQFQANKNLVANELLKDKQLFDNFVSFSQLALPDTEKGNVAIGKLEQMREEAYPLFKKIKTLLDNDNQ